jgi:predicted RNase H-like nuclease (RuvC/YqgF family)
MAATSARSSDLFAKLAAADSRVAELEARLAAAAQQLEAERSGHSKSVEQLQQHVKNVRERWASVDLWGLRAFWFYEGSGLFRLDR